MIGRTVDGGDLPCTERALEGILYLAISKTQGCQLVAVNIEGNHRTEVVEIVGHIDEAWQLADALGQGSRPLVQFIQIGILQGILILRRRDLATYSNDRGFCIYDLMPGTAASFGRKR